MDLIIHCCVRENISRSKEEVEEAGSLGSS